MSSRSKFQTPDSPEAVLGWFGDIMECVQNIKGFHGIISSLVPDPTDPITDQVFTKFDGNLMKILKKEEKFHFLNLRYRVLRVRTY